MQADSDPPILHCPHCYDEVHTLSHFCTTCGMPITSHATIGPLEHVWAWGWFINRLLERRPSTMTVLGTWLISLPFLIPAIPTLLVLPPLTPVDDLPHTLIGVIPTAIFAACHGLLVVRVTWAYYRGEPNASGSHQRAA
ncbi:MAG: hypothetical protein ACYTAU_12375 [Planctomycetota bacterium]